MASLNTGHPNQALLTGESLPTAVEVRSEVHAGSQNIASTLRIRASRVGGETRVGELMQLIERGLRDKPAIVQLADRVGGYFIVVLCCVSAAVFGYWARISVPLAIDHTVALLIVTCPCVLGLTTPLTIAIAIGRLARQDILVKSGAVLERLSRGGRLLLDKTGTITAGKMEMVKWIGDPRWQSIVAKMEARSNHPIGRTLFDSLAPTLVGQAFLPAVELMSGGHSCPPGSTRIRSAGQECPALADSDRQECLSYQILL
jgi:Cu2+-exporting ATPase